MGSAPRLLEITPPSRAVGGAAKFGVGVMLFPQLFLFAVLVLLAVYFPFARVVLGVCRHTLTDTGPPTMRRL